MKAKELKKRLRLKPSTESNLKPEDLLSTGCTLLNLASTGMPEGGFIKGKYHFVVGDSMSGKTFLGLTCLAEACRNPDFDGYRLIYDDVEDGALMSLEKFFGRKVVDRLESPGKDRDGSSVFSNSIEQFYYHLDDAFKEDQPFIYVLDSMDGLTSEWEESKFTKKKEAARKGKEISGTMTDNKAKINSTHMRLAQKKLRMSKSILIVINQTRDNLGFGFETKTRSGGRSLTFYATTELWSSVIKTLYKTVKGNKREVGVMTRVKIKKNRGTGKLRVIEFPIYHSYGIDDLTASIDFLLHENHWKSKGKKIKAPEFEFIGSQQDLIKHIESNRLKRSDRLERRLAEIVTKVWNEIEAACEVDRKKRYQ